MKTLHNTVEQLRAMVRYDPVTGHIYRLTRNASSKPAYLERSKKGPRIFVGGKHYRARVLVWALVTGEFPKLWEVRCVDGDLYNLRLSNFYKPPSGRKLCAKCKQEKCQSEFSANPQQRSGKDSYCKLCKWSIAQPNRRKNELAARARKFGLTAEELERMNTKQNEQCCICGVPEKALKRRLCVDHCHATGKVRALLCAKCNAGLGAFGDDPRLLIAAAKYLIAHGKT